MKRRTRRWGRILFNTLTAISLLLAIVTQCADQLKRPWSSVAGWLPLSLSAAFVLLYLASFAEPIVFFEGQKFWVCSANGSLQFLRQIGNDLAPENIVCTFFLPYALLALVAASPYVVTKLITAMRKRIPPAHCPACGYDIRANPAKCSECGHETPAKTDVEILESGCHASPYAAMCAAGAGHASFARFAQSDKYIARRQSA